MVPGRLSVLNRRSVICSPPPHSRPKPLKRLASRSSCGWLAIAVAQLGFKSSTAVMLLQRTLIPPVCIGLMRKRSASAIFTSIIPSRCFHTPQQPLVQVRLNVTRLLLGRNEGGYSHHS